MVGKRSRYGNAAYMNILGPDTVVHKLALADSVAYEIFVHVFGYPVLVDGYVRYIYIEGNLHTVFLLKRREVLYAHGKIRNHQIGTVGADKLFHVIVDDSLKRHTV